MSYFGSYFKKAILQTYTRFKAPNLDAFHNLYKFPQNAKIVLLNVPEAKQDFVNDYFRDYNKIDANDFMQKNQNQVKNLAKVLLKQENQTIGNVLTNVNLNSKQANELDLMTDGVNLVINFGDQKNELTKFYDTRGLLLNFEIDNSNFYQAKKDLDDAILGNIKL